MTRDASAKLDLADTTDALEHLAKTLSKLQLKAKVDVAARLRGIVKICEAMDKSVKAEIKEYLKERDGDVKGDIFKAVLKYTDVTRFDQTAFKEEEPKQYELYCNTAPEGKITFGPR